MEAAVLVTLGRYLIQRGICTRAQVDQAGRSKVVFGGRMGTNLVEMGHLEVDQLEELLAEHLGLRPVPQEWLASDDPSVRDALPRHLMEKYQVLPLALHGMQLHVALLDPRDRALVEELQFVSGCDVVPHVLSEIRMNVLLAYHYDIPCDPRFLNLAPPITGPRSGAARAEDSAEELIDEDTFHAMHAAWQVQGEEKPEPPTTTLRESADTAPEAVPRDASAAQCVSPILEMERALLSAPNRDAIADAALALGASYAEALALFVVRSGIVTGFRGDGRALPHYIEGIMLPVEVESAFAQVARHGTSYRGPLTEKLDLRIASALGREDVRDVLIAPIRIQRHVVNLLYADAGGLPLAATHAAALEAIAPLASHAYQQLILRTKSVADGS